MILGMFAIEDIKAQLFNVPFFMRSSGEALRAFADLAVDKQSKISAHPMDYRLWRLGSYDDETGTIEQNGVALARADEFVPSAPVGLKVAE